MISNVVFRYVDENSPESEFISLQELKTELEKSGLREFLGNYINDADPSVIIETEWNWTKPKTLPLLTMLVIDGKIVWPNSVVHEKIASYIFVPSGSCIVYKPYIDAIRGKYSPEGFFEKYQKIIPLPEPIKIISLDDLFHYSLVNKDSDLIMFESEIQTFKKLIEA